MFRPHKTVRASRHNHWTMTYVEMVKVIASKERPAFDVLFRSQLYEYVPMAHDKKILYNLVEAFPTLIKLLPKRRNEHV